MTLSPAFLDELRARTLLSSVIAPTVKLTRAGREWKACCPFHQEKTPSFTINDDKAFYHCFGCGAHGDAIRFLTDARGLPFMEAVKELADKAGLEVPAPDPRAQVQAERSTTLIDVMTAAQAWFQEQLAGPEGAAAREYIKSRGIGAATAQRFGLGLAPNARTRLKQALAEHGEDKLVDTGLLIRPEEKGETYDRFRGRLTIPIRDARGRVIAFGGRILGDGEPKYLNSPETVLFDKGRTLYNLDRAAPASRQAGRVIVVEGYLDVIGLDRVGIAEVVAPLGTALTEGQLERLWRLDPQPILCFDGDRAGQKAAIRAAMRALPHLAHDRTLRFVALPEGQDPDDLATSGGRDAVEALLGAPVPLVERLWAHERDAEALTTPEARAGLRKRLLDHVAAIGDRALAGLYRDEWLERFSALTRPAQQARAGQVNAGAQRRGQWVKGKGFVPPEAPASAAARAIASGGISPPLARAILTGLSLFPEVIAGHAETLARLPFNDQADRKWRDLMVDAAYSGQTLDRDGLVTILQGIGGVVVPSGSGRGIDMGFSFTRGESDPVRAQRDLGDAIDALAAQGEIAEALANALERLKNGDETALAEQLRLYAVRQELNERLANLVASD